MKKLSAFTMVALLMAVTPAYAQTTNPSPEPGTMTMSDSGYHQAKMAVVGKIIAIDLADGTLTLDDGTQFALPPSFQFTSFPALGEQVEVTYDEQGGNKVARSIDAGWAGQSGSGE
jgi:hypothetical protein